MGSAVYAQAASSTSSEQPQGTDDVIDAVFCPRTSNVYKTQHWGIAKEFNY
ncbi:hypothetical protein NIES25_56380 (plasmid) [Nostoc linckia NIES-25]|nr:hypothetical protein NIES25_56380 [Nostoc linckia NIES-25]